MRYIARIYKSIFKWMPFPAIYTILDYIYGAFVPAFVTIISVNLFNSAAEVVKGVPEKNELYLYAAMYLAVYLVNDVSTLIRSITLNACIYEKGTAYFRIALYEKLAKLPLILFENTDILNKKERAEKAINNETLSAIFNHTMRFFRSSVSVISVAAVLVRYNIWLLPLSLLSVIPYLVARLARGKEFFYVKKHQAKKTRLMSYLWSLFTSRQTAKEMRVMGFDGYITDKWCDTRDEVNEELWAVQKKDAISLLLCDGFRIICYGISLIVVLLLVLHGKVSIGVFGAAITAFLSLQNGMQNALERLGR
ncbi:MAG: ABC transporter transmembrane domain-containing protein, partial [Ruminiclostridium sp.]|nr:ABC transporter transmembrane domain-containing protein [Ruminiclostridium sp.]